METFFPNPTFRGKSCWQVLNILSDMLAHCRFTLINSPRDILADIPSYAGGKFGATKAVLLRSGFFRALGDFSIETGGKTAKM